MSTSEHTQVNDPFQHCSRARNTAICSSLSLNQFPPEVLHRIFKYTDVPDILRLRRVSRYLNEVSHNKHVWREAYRTAECVHPPGPFAWQSKDDLENLLVSSCRVERNLRHGGGTAQTERPTFKVKEIRYTDVGFRARLIFGRFLLVAFGDQVHCYDLNLDALDSDSDGIIYQTTTGWTLKSFHCVSAIDFEGHPFACVVLNEETEATAHISIYLVHVGEESKLTLDLVHQFEHCGLDIESVDLGPRVIVIQGQDIDPEGDFRLSALGVHTHTVFKLSPFVDAALMETGEVPNLFAIEEFTSSSNISTSTHVLMARSFYGSTVGWRTFFQAFALPHNNPIPTPTATALGPSHHGLVSGIKLSHTVLLQDAVIDPTTQDVLIAIRVHMFEPSQPPIPLSKHGVLRLSAVNSSSDHPIGTITFQPLGPFSHPRIALNHPSFTGTGRVFYMRHERGSRAVISTLEYDVRARVHGNRNGDNDEAHEAKVVEYPDILRLPTKRILFDYDPYLGRICLLSGMKKHSVIEVLSFAV